MSRAWARRRAALFAAAAAPAATPGVPVRVGEDFARRRGGARRPRRVRRVWIPALAACVLAALLLTALRIHVLRLRYQLGEAVRTEMALLEERRSATVRLRELRDPRRLRRLADELGMVRPERVIERRVPAGAAAAAPPPAAGDGAS